MRLVNHLLVEASNADFMETCSCIGIVCGKSLGNKIKKFVDTNEGDPQKLLDEIKKVVGSGGYDWNNSGVSAVKELSLEKPNRVHVAFNLVVGMNIFMQDVGYKVVGTKPYFIHDYITSYYVAERESFGEIPYTKSNTADCVISSVPHKQLLKDIREGGKSDKSSQYIKTVEGSKYIQVSLKKDDGAAQLGKVTGFIKSIYDIENVSTATQELTTENYLSEGIWDKIKSIGGKVFGKLKTITSSFLNKISKKFKKVNNKHLSDFEKAMGINEATQDTMVESILNDPKKATSLVNNEAIKLKHMASSDMPIKINLIQNIKVKTSSDVYKLISNYLAFRMFQEMMVDEGKLKHSINRIIGEMFFGGTKMPLWKVFGYFKSNSYHYLGTLDAFVDKKTDYNKVEIMGVRANSSTSFYSITLYLLEKMDDKGKTYILLRTGTNSSSHPTFVVEGKSKHDVVYDKSLESIM